MYKSNKKNLGGNKLMRKLSILLTVSMMILSISTTVYAQVQVHGFVLARTTFADTTYTSRIERYGLQFKETIDDEFDWLTEFYIHPHQPSDKGLLYMESAYLNWHLKNKLPWDFNVRIGKGRSYCYGITPSYGNRRTTEYSLYSLAFTQMRITGFQTYSNFGDNIQLAVAIINPYKVNVPAPRTLPDFPVGSNLPVSVSDRDNDNSTFRRFALSGRLGYKNSMLNIGANLYASDPKENVDGAKSRLGFDAEIALENGLIAQAQYTMARTQIECDGTFEDLDHMGFEVMGGYEREKLALYARFGMMTYDDQLQDLNSLMLSAVYKIRPLIHFRIEGLINSETTREASADKAAWDESDNNVLIFETMFLW